MPVTPDQIVEYISAKSYRPVRVRELARGLNVPETEYRAFRRLVKQLVKDGTIARIKGGRLGQPDKLSLKTGSFKSIKSGAAFVKPDDGSEEIYVPPEDTSTALDRDTVVVRVKPSSRGKSPEGAVVKVLKRNRNVIVGTFQRSRHFETVRPDDTAIGRDIYVQRPKEIRPEVGEKVVVALSGWKNPMMNPEGEIIEVLGHPEDPGVDIMSAIRDFGLPTEFPDKVEAAARNLSLDITEKTIAGRLDLRNEVLFTIDPADAKDYDDAVSIQEHEDGRWTLGVHIADVSHYVNEGSIIDIEARERATSVYLVDRVLPMLPETLSNEICSLKGHEDRLAFSCIMDIGKTGRVTKYRIVPSVIHSKGRLSYDEVQEYFDTGKPTKRLKGLTDSLDKMRQLAAFLREKRLAKGSLDFDLPEPRVILDKSGDVVDLQPRARKEAHKLVEDFMLLANQTVAEHFIRLGLPTLFRVHDVPDTEKLNNFREFAKGFGHDLKFTDPPKPSQLARFLKRIEGTPEEDVLSEFLLRSLKKAVYQPENIGHFGLAFKNYLHFTSPIRRYPDLFVHRLLKEIKNGRYPGQRTLNIKRLLKRVGEHSSERERLAEEAERETVKIKQAVYLSRHVGDVFEGVISGIASFGFFVRLSNLSAEGVVRLSTLSDDYYKIDDNRTKVFGVHSSNTFSLGDKIHVQVINVDLDRYQTNLRLIEEKPKRKKRSKAGKRHRKR